MLVALSILALAMRAPYLGRAYWVDEGISVGIASHPLRQIPGLLRQDGSPPLFYVVLHFWITLVGTSEPATHLLALLTSLLIIPIGYWAGREIFDRSAGLAAAALFATNPFLNWYSTETRMYPMVILFSLVGVTLAWRAARDHTPLDAAGAVAAFVALAYTHNWGLYLAAATVAVLVGRAWLKDDHAQAGRVVGAAATGTVLWLPWVPTFLYQAGHTAAPWAARPGLGDFFADPATALGGTVQVLVAPALLAGAWLGWRQIPLRNRGGARVLGLIALAATSIGFLGAVVEPSWTVRYLAIIVAPYLLAAAGALAPTPGGRNVVGAVVVVLSAWSFVGILLPNPSAAYAKDNVAAVVAAAAGHLHPGDLVVVTQTEQTAAAAHYLPSGLRYVNPTGPVADPFVVDWRDIVHRLQRADPCRSVAPAIDALPVGATVLDINPVRKLGASGSAWSRVVNGQAALDQAFLAADPALTAVAVYTPALEPRPFAPVDGVLYEKTSLAPSCG